MTKHTKPLTAPAHLRRIARLDTSGLRRRDVWINARAAEGHTPAAIAAALGIAVGTAYNAIGLHKPAAGSGAQAKTYVRVPVSSTCGAPALTSVSLPRAPWDGEAIDFDPRTETAPRRNRMVASTGKTCAERVIEAIRAAHAAAIAGEAEAGLHPRAHEKQ